MTISIVVPAYNEARGLPATLASIQRAAAAFDARGWRHELIVCDNNSTDGTGDIARAAGATVVFEPINQISRARNAGAARASGDWLLFVDADSHPSPELFADAADAMAGGRCLAGGATVTIDSTDRLGRAVVGLWNAISRSLRLAAGSFIFCDAKAFREVGGFSLEFYATEELDLFKRLKRLARDRGRTIVILHAHPLVTSDRKARLYTKRELAAGVLKSALTLGRAVRNRDDCYMWYDGRRE
ncbi:MAG TPA: glycosyltransferase [Vicinamibacterales bacterium]|jgi:glycosyltransferase involved in cell wall biosynthesis|nr:glycosyltransferase [Vicinamibacterales bacterium]